MTNGEAAAILESEAEFLYSQDEPYSRQAFKMAIEALQERKAGKWKKILIATVPFTIYGYECPFCEFRTVADSFNFCPNCGAKMATKGRIKNEEADKEG